MTVFMLLLALNFAHASEKPIRIQLPAEPSTLDPYHVSDVIGFNIISNASEGLFRLDGVGKLEPGLASHHRASKDGLKHWFTLRPGAKWSDGAPVTVEDFIFGLNYARDPKTAARDISLLGSFKSARRDGQELLIELAYQDSSFLQALTMPFAHPLRKENLVSGSWKEGTPSAGPYRISSHKPDREIFLEPNPNYPGHREPMIFKVVPEETTALNLFETGIIDILAAIPTTEIKRLDEAGFIKVFPSAASFYLGFNLLRPPFSDIRWRRALAQAVDRESLARLMPKGFRTTTSYVPASVEGSTPFQQPNFEKDLAWFKSEKREEAPLVYASTAVSNLLLQRLQNDLAKSMALNVKLEPMEWKAFLGRLTGGAPSLFFMGYSAPFNDPMSHLKVFKSDEPDNRAHYQNHDYDLLLDEIKKESGSRRVQAIHKAGSLLTQKDIVILPLLERQQIYGVGKGIKNFRVNAHGVMDLRQISR